MHLKHLITPVIVSLLTACSGIPVSQDYVAGTDFSALHSYRWSENILNKEKETEGNNPLLNTRIHTAIDRKLASMGYRLSDATTADFAVSYQTDLRTRLRSDGPTGMFSFGFGNFGHFGAVGISTGDAIRDEDEAALIIDILNGHDEHLLWRGISTRYVYTHNEPDELTKTINEHVDAILAQFPPGKEVRN